VNSPIGDERRTPYNSDDMPTYRVCRDQAELSDDGCVAAGLGRWLS
jgi:hypothetical protein